MTEKNGVERSTATDVLRRLLDEHGVKHKDFFDQTWWEDSDGAAYTAVETRPLYNNNPSTKLMLKRTATPEQAIAATLGSCNCSNNCTNSERTETCKLTMDGTDGCFGCSECLENIPPLANYCPNCGRKVVDA